MAPFRQLQATAAMEATAQQASIASHSPRGMGFSVKVRQLAEEVETLVDLLARKLLQPLGAELLHSK